MLAMHTSYRNEESNQADSYLSGAVEAQAGRRRWIGQTVVAGVLGAIALAVALFLTMQISLNGNSMPGAVILGVVVSGAVAGAVQARRLPGYTSAPISGWITGGVVVCAGGAGLGIAWLRALRLGATPGWDAGLGAIYAGIALSGALLVAAGLGLLLHTSRLPLTTWSVASELDQVGEALAWAGPAAALLLFFIACGMGLPVPSVLFAGLGLATGAGIGFVLGRLVK